MNSSADHTFRPRLSVAMIVRDEQDVLAASIEGVRAIADEIVVLDTGSVDETPALGKRLGATVGRREWTDDFSAARNHCAKLATGDWILWLDAGERLDGEWATELRAFVDQDADPTRVYLVLVQVPPAGKGASAEQIAQPRLVPNHPDLQFTGRLRETLRPAAEAAGLEIGVAPGRIVRHPRRHDPARKARIAQRDLHLLTLEAAKYAPERLPARLLLAQGEAYSNLGDEPRARQAYLEAVEAAEHGSPEMLEAYGGLLSVCEGVPSLADQQLATCLEALEIFPLDAQLLLAMGGYLQARNRIDLAVRSFETAMKFGQVELETWHFGELAEMVADCLSLALQIQEKDDQARCVLEEALARNEKSTRLRRRLIELCVEQVRGPEALALARQLPVPAEGLDPLLDAIRGACKAADKDWTAALGYLQSAYAAGCREPLCLRWLAVTLLSNGEITAAEPVLRAWEQIEPANVELQTYLAALRASPEVPASKVAPTETPPATEVSQRLLRIDKGMTVLEVAPRQFPVISQSTSADWPVHPAG